MGPYLPTHGAVSPSLWPLGGTRPKPPHRHHHLTPSNWQGFLLPREQEPILVVQADARQLPGIDFEGHGDWGSWAAAHTRDTSRTRPSLPLS